MNELLICGLGDVPHQDLVLKFTTITFSQTHTDYLPHRGKVTCVHLACVCVLLTCTCVVLACTCMVLACTCVVLACCLHALAWYLRAPVWCFVNLQSRKSMRASQIPGVIESRHRLSPRTHLAKDDVVTYMLLHAAIAVGQSHPKKESVGKVARKSEGVVHLSSKVIYDWGVT